MKIVKAAVSSLAIASASGVFAQTPLADAYDQGEPGRQSSTLSQTTLADADGSSGEGDIGAVTEIIVTAQRRSERLVDVPISVATVSGDELERADPSSLASLNKLVPGIYMQRDAYGLSPTIRGIGSTLATSGGESNVSVYIDGVYQPYQAANVFDLASIAGVEVLKGPQGTLFGRNATGGAILVKTLDPSFSPEARLRVSYERFDRARGSGYLNLPITDRLAANAAVTYRHSAGHIRDNRTGRLVNEGSDLTARVKALFEPTDTLSIVLSGYHSEFDDPTGASFQVLEPAPLFSLPGVDAGPIASDRYHTSHNTEGKAQTESDQWSLRVNLDLGPGRLTSITSTQKSHLVSVNELDATYATVPALVPITLPPPIGTITVPFPTDFSVALRTDRHVVTQEVNFTSNPGSDLQYVAGAFYYYSRGAAPYLLQNGAPTLDTVGHTRTLSGYFDGNYRLGKVVLIGGLRYTHEDRDNRSNFFGSSPGTRYQEETEEVWTPRVGVKYEFSPQANVYATYTRGYKSGIFDGTAPNGPAVDPEFVDAYEIGFKTSLRKLTLNAAAYFYEFRGTQVNATVSGPSGIFQQLFNVPKSEIYGFDVDGTYWFNEAFDVRMSLAYTHARYIDFPNAPDYAIDPSDPATFGLFYSNVSSNASGNHMVRAPEVTASGAINYHANLGEGRRLDASVSGAYTSRIYFDFMNNMSQPGYFTVDADLTVSFGDHLSLSVFGRNLTDEIYLTSKSVNQLGVFCTYAYPRTYGISLDYRF